MVTQEQICLVLQESCQKRRSELKTRDRKGTGPIGTSLFIVPRCRQRSILSNFNSPVLFDMLMYILFNTFNERLCHLQRLPAALQTIIVFTTGYCVYLQ